MRRSSLPTAPVGAPFLWHDGAVTEARGIIGTKAKNTVRDNFLLTRLLEDWVDLLMEKTLRSNFE